MARAGAIRLLVVLGALALVACSAATVVGYYGVNHAAQKRDRAAKAELDGYLDAVRAGDLEAAYGMLCIDSYDFGRQDGGALSKAEYATFVQSQPRFQSFTTEVVGGTSGMDGTYAYSRVVLLSAGVGVARFYLDVGMETHGPRVCDGPGFRLDSPGPVGG